MNIVKGLPAALAMKHGLGRVVKKFPPQVRVTKKEKIQLQELVTGVNREKAARRNGTNGHAHEAPGEAPANLVAEPGPRALTDEHLNFFIRLANDTRLPKDIRTEAFTYSLAD